MDALRAGDREWAGHREQWGLRADTVYLNHGSFGPPPPTVRAARRQWIAALDEQPMDFLVRSLRTAWTSTRQRLADWLDTAVDNLILVDNATYAMNVVAASLSLRAGDEVLLTDHEYGAVHRIWRRSCEQVGAELRQVRLPRPLESVEQIVAAIRGAITARTRLLVVSHLTSPTAVILPVQEICEAARQRDVAVCIDGPHALAQLPLSLDRLDCDFYAASCHKWLCAPFGSGLLYVHPRQQEHVRPPVLSWGRWPDEPTPWQEEFHWLGTRDPSAWLAIPAAIDFLESVGWSRFRMRTHELAAYARQQITALTRLAPLVPDSPLWYGSMAQLPLPAGDAARLQATLWTDYHIEVPVIRWSDQRWIRVSCHLYTASDDIDRLVAALDECLHRRL